MTGSETRKARVTQVGSRRATRVDIHGGNIGTGADAGGSLERLLRDFEVEIVGHGRAPPLEGGIPVVLYGVISPTREQTGYGGPFVPKLGVSPDNRLVLVGRKSPMLHLRRELITPAEPARLPGTTRNRLADQGPIPGAMLLNQPLQQLIFFGAPRALDPIRFFSVGDRPHGCLLVVQYNNHPRA